MALSERAAQPLVLSYNLLQPEEVRQVGQSDAGEGEQWPGLSDVAGGLARPTLAEVDYRRRRRSPARRGLARGRCRGGGRASHNVVAGGHVGREEAGPGA